jgi:hypothetical protein
MLTDQQLFDSVAGTDLGNELNDLGVPEATIASNNQEGPYINKQR